MNSPEYQRVLTNKANIVEALRGTPGATGRLTTEFEQKSWLAVNENPTEDRLVNAVLARIKLKPANLTTFIDMLKKVNGLDEIVEILEGCKEDSICVVYIYIGLFYLERKLNKMSLVHKEDVRVQGHVTNRSESCTLKL